jgi:hydrogenase 3 maturation protease
MIHGNKKLTDADKDIEQKLLNWLANCNKIAVVGIGNELRQDDFIGSRIVRNLKKDLTSDKILILDCETVPENYLGVIERFKPSHILVIDAAQIGLDPGKYMLVGFEKVRGEGISTHDLSLEIFAEYIKKVTDAELILLAIQPKSIEFETGLTEDLSKTAEEITDLLLKVLTQ